MGNNVSSGLATIATGLNQFSNVLEYQDQIEQKKKELEFRKQQFELDQKKFQIADKEAAFNEFGKLQTEYTQLENENKSSASDWLKMSDTQTKLQELAPRMGVSVERIPVMLKNEADYFRIRRDASVQGLSNYATLLEKNGNPELATGLRGIAGVLGKTTDKAKFEEVGKDARDLLTSAFTFQRQNQTSEDAGALTRAQFYDKFKEVTSDTPGAQAIPIKGGGTMTGILKPQEVKVSPAESARIRESIATNFGFNETTLKYAKPDTERGKFLPEIDELTSQAEQQMKAGSTPQQAVQQVMKGYQKQNADVDSKLQALVNASKDARDIIRKRLGTVELKRIPYMQKKMLLDEMLSSQNQGQ